MRADELNDLCLAFSGSVETQPFGEGLTCFKVAGKIFAIVSSRGDPLTLSLKCEPGLAEQLREMHPAINPGWHLNKRHWNTVTLDGSLSPEMVADMVQDSYDLIVSGLARHHQRALRWKPDADG